MCLTVARKLSISQSEAQSHQKQTTVQTGSICSIIKTLLGPEAANKLMCNDEEVCFRVIVLQSVHNNVTDYIRQPICNICCILNCAVLCKLKLAIKLQFVLF